MIPELTKLKQINNDLETHKVLSRQNLLDMGIIQASRQAVCRVGASSDQKQSLPFSLNLS